MPASNIDTHTDAATRARKRYFLWSLILFAIVFGLVLYYFSSIKKELLLIRKVKPFWLCVAVLAQCATYFFTAVIYQVLLKCYFLKERPGIVHLFKASIVSLFFNQTIPSAGISGNAFFLKFLSRYNIVITSVISLIVSELLIFYAAIFFVITGLYILYLFFYKVAAVFTGTLIAGGIVYFIFAFIIAMAGRRKTIYRFLKKATTMKIFKSFFVVADKRISVDDFTNTESPPLSFIRIHKKASTVAFFFQVILIMADALTVFALYKGLGLPLSFFTVLLCCVCTKIISILPFLPGSLILYESSMSFFFVSSGVSLGNAIIVTLLYRLLSYWLLMPIGLLLYRHWGKKRTR